MAYRRERPLLADGYRSSFYCWDGHGRVGDCLLYLHGIESHAGWFIESASLMNARGWPVVLAERRGSGRNTEDRGHTRSYRQLLADVFCAARYCQQHWPTCRVHLAGVSWGGKLALAAALKRPEFFASLTMITPGIFPQVSLSAKQKLAVLFKHLFKPKAMLAVPLEDAKLFTDNPEQIDFIEHDELRLHRASVSFFWSSYRLDKLIQRKGHRLAMPVHLLLSGRDRIIDSEKTRAWFERCTAPEKYLSEFPDSAHTLEFARDNRGFLEAFGGWLDKQSQQESPR
ncbi:MAG: alpha/beta fold hydrolase [Phycisphaerae bacterium]|nr:alpha/beta fold hydrolase [Phycisphaerae bacterium]